MYRKQDGCAEKENIGTLLAVRASRIIESYTAATGNVFPENCFLASFHSLSGNWLPAGGTTCHELRYTTYRPYRITDAL